MSNPVLLDRPRPADTRATDFATWEATHLRVRDLDRALRFWRDLLDFQGHIHLHAGDLASSARFYERVGFHANPSFMGMRDFNARGSFAHRLAINEWQGHGVVTAPDAAGLHHLELTYPDANELQEALANLRRDGSVLLPLERRPGAWVVDPSGNAIELTVPTT